jgi:hypothetical protein
MRRLILLSFHAALLATLFCSMASGQTTVPSSRFRPLPAEYPDATAPLVEFGAYDYDSRMFAPYDLRELDEPTGPVGFYFTYDRVYINVSRASVQPNTFPGDEIFVPTGNDFMWGNRFEAGVMNCNGAGWGGEYTRSSGSYFSAGSDILIGNPFMTTTAVHNVKLNRVFRQDLQAGGWLEPYFGFRFLGVSDNTIEDSIVNFNGTDNNARFKQNATNSAFGGHVGARHVRKLGRWGVSTDASLAATYNAQGYRTTDILSTATTISIFETYMESSGFCPALDLRADLSYAITRDLALRLGGQILYIWDGVNRANTLPSIFNPNSVVGPGGVVGIFDESFVTAGFNFGIEWKR